MRAAACCSPRCLPPMIVWIVGLAVPVTASYIMCAVIAAPALIKLGVPDYAAHMFIFYYAVLSEVSPPTALSPFAAAAITGGDPYKTTLQAWKYTMPAFLVPFVFVLDPQGVGLLLNNAEGRLAGSTSSRSASRPRSASWRSPPARRAGCSAHDLARALPVDPCRPVAGVPEPDRGLRRMDHADATSSTPLCRRCHRADRLGDAVVRHGA